MNKPTSQRLALGLTTFLALLLPALAWADEPPVLNSGDTAWMLTATALVLFMTIPGLALFYGGLVRAKNVLSILMQCFTLAAMMTVLWILYGYSLAFSTQGMEAGTINLNSFVGGLDRVLLAGLTRESLTGSFPEAVFITFQMTFAIITPALMVGAFAERMKFSAMLWFMAIWFTLVYAPIAHMVWGGDGGLMHEWGVIDFAGGTVVHINAGVAALIAAIMLGKRRGYPTTAMPPHNLGYTVIGASMLWVGWFGFNAGSALAADESAGMAMLVTQAATAAAVLAWIAVEWITHRKASVLGAATGAVAGLVAITPAAGSVGPLGALAIGATSGIICFVASTKLKRALGYDDSLDVFGVHAVGGIVGAILTGVFVSAALGGAGLDEGMTIASQTWAQTLSVLFTILYTGVLSWIILKLIDVTIGLRVSEEEETEGLDLSQHGERGYIL